jgi:hypothetical protein
MLLALAASTFFALWGSVRGSVVWQDWSVGMIGWTMPIILASYLLGSGSSASEWRDGSEEFLDSLQEGRTTRSIGRLGGAVAPVGFSILVAGVSMLVGLGANPAGNVMWSELAAAPLVAGVSWSIGCLTGGIRRFRAAPVLILVLYAFAQLLASPDIEIGAAGPSRTDLGRLMLWQPPSAFESPFALLLRPSTPRLAYLGAVFTASALFLASSGRKVSRGVWLSAAVVAAVLAVGALGSWVLAVSREVPWAALSFDRPRVDWQVLTSLQECSPVEQRMYCPYPGFEPWVEEWSSAVGYSALLAPNRVKGVVQRPPASSFDGMDPGGGWLVTGFSWDSPGSGKPVYAFALAAASANLTVGLPAGYQVGCDAQRQGRSVVPLWAAATSTERGMGLLRDLAESPGAKTSIGGVSLGNAIIGDQGADLAVELARLSRDSVAVILMSRFDELVDPMTSVEEVAGWFGIELRETAPPNPALGAPECG